MKIKRKIAETKLSTEIKQNDATFDGTGGKKEIKGIPFWQRWPFVVGLFAIIVYFSKELDSFFLALVGMGAVLYCSCKGNVKWVKVLSMGFFLMVVLAALFVAYDMILGSR